MMRKLFVIALAATLAGCATQGKYKAVLDSWVGEPAQSLVDKWGYPESQMKAPDGNDVYVYRRSGSISLPTTSTTNATTTVAGNTAYTNATTNSYGGGDIDLACTTYFEIGPDQRILNYRAQGNNCISM